MGLLLVVVCVEGAAVARSIHPCGTEVYAVIKLVVGSDVDVVATVILGMEGATLIDGMSLTVKLAHGLRPSVAYPAGELAH